MHARSTERRRGLLLGREHVEADDRERRADERVRAPEAPQRDRRRGRRGPGGCRRASPPAALLQPAAGVEHRADGTNTAPASEPAMKRAANWSRPRTGVIGARTRSAAAPRPPRGRRPVRAYAHGGDRVGRPRLRYHAGASGTYSTSANPARSIQPRYSASGGKSIQMSASARRSRLRRAHRADHGRPAAGAQHAIGLGDAALGVRPVLDRARGHVAVERVVAERERLRVALELLHARESLRRASSTRRRSRTMVGS